MNIYAQNEGNQTYLIYELDGQVIEKAKLITAHHCEAVALRHTKGTDLIMREHPAAPGLYGIWESVLVDQT